MKNNPYYLIRHDINPVLYHDGDTFVRLLYKAEYAQFNVDYIVSIPYDDYMLSWEFIDIILEIAIKNAVTVKRINNKLYIFAIFGNVKENVDNAHKEIAEYVESLRIK